MKKKITWDQDDVSRIGLGSSQRPERFLLRLYIVWLPTASAEESSSVGGIVTVR